MSPHCGAYTRNVCVVSISGSINPPKSPLCRCRRRRVAMARCAPAHCVVYVDCFGLSAHAPAHAPVVVLTSLCASTRPLYAPGRDCRAAAQLHGRNVRSHRYAVNRPS